MYAHLLAILLTVGGNSPSVSAAEQIHTPPAETSCPADDRYTRAAVEIGADDAQVRALWGVGDVGPADLRVLTDDRDAALCQHFKSNVRSTPGGATAVKWVYYQLGSFYIVTVRRTDGTFGLGSSVMWVYDSNLQNRGLWAL